MMAKKSPSKRANKSSCLTLADVPSAAAPPASVTGLADAVTRDAASDAWRAASMLGACIDLWENWLDELELNGDADPVVASRLSEECSASIFSLCSLGAFHPLFRSLSADALIGSLPHVPIRSGWQSDKSHREAFAAARLNLTEIRGGCSALLSQLERGPVAALGWTDSANENVDDDANEKENPKPEKLPLDVRATALLMKHPDWTNTRIAEHLGCARTSLNAKRMKNFKAARATQRAGADDLPRGSKYKGDIEAWDDE